jgi:hypothetical protein
MTFIDSNSEDGTHKILKDFADKVTIPVQLLQTGANWWDHERLHVYRNEIWKGTDFDLVFFPDCDEIFYHPNIRQFLEENNFDVYELEGYEMVSEGFPVNGNILTLNKGVQFHWYNKSTLFNPRCNITFPNAHLRSTKSANVNMGEIKLLHYRRISVEMMIKRRDRIKYRIPKGYMRLMSDDQIR